MKNNHSKKILIVEDETAMLKILVYRFKHEGFVIFKAKNGEDGLKFAFKEHPDLILLDIILPKIDGMTVLKRLREDEWGKNVPVIILTNLVEGEKVSKALEKGVYDFLIKTDWELEDVVKRVREKLGIDKSNY